MTFWKINCMETTYPGMWQRWYVNQCVAVGWAGSWGFHLQGETDGGHGWSVTRNILNRMQIGDQIAVALSGHRIGRIGEVTGLAVEDSDWTPLVPKDNTLPDGEMGRRIAVRWDLLAGPDDREMVVSLPLNAQLTSGELRPTLSEIRSTTVETLKSIMKDESNWTALWAHFDYERALSGYIAAYPHRLEEGLLPYPNGKIRERVFPDGSRLDVILVDRSGVPVIVECKQGHPTTDNLNQLRGYLRNLEAETGVMGRGILVHGGAKRLRRDVLSAANEVPAVEVVQYRLDVDFRTSD